MGASTEIRINRTDSDWPDVEGLTLDPTCGPPHGRSAAPPRRGPHYAKTLPTRGVSADLSGSESPDAPSFQGMHAPREDVADTEDTLPGYVECFE